MQPRRLQLYRLLQHPLPRPPPIPSLPLALPILPAQPPHLRPHNSSHPPRNQTDTNRPIRITIQRVPRIRRIALKPHMIKRHNLRRLDARRARRDPVPREAYYTLDRYVRWVCWGPVVYHILFVSFLLSLPSVGRSFSPPVERVIRGYDGEEWEQT